MGRTFRPQGILTGLFAGFGLLLAVDGSGATDFYVKKGTGCQRGHPSCGVDEPGREFDDVDLCALALRPGDTCWIKEGTYTNGATRNDRGTYVPRRGGRRDARITFRAYPGHQPLFQSDAAWTLGVAGETHYVTYAGLSVDGVIRIQGDDESDRVKGVIVENCDIYGGGGKNDGNWSGIFAQWTEDLVVRNNHIHDTRVDGSSKGISIFNGRRTVVEHNYIHGNKSEAVFDKEGGENNVYRRNIFENNGKHLKINNQRDERGLYNVGTEIYENLFLCDTGGGSTSVLMLKRPTKWKVYNNTAFECQGIEVRSRSGPAQGDAVYNNIWWRSETRKMMWSSQVDDDREPAYMDHNLYAVGGKFRENRGAENKHTSYGLTSWAAREHPLRYDQHSLEADPLFVDTAARNFRLAPDSPARGAGRGGEHLGAYPRNDSADIGPITPGVRAARPEAGPPPAAPAGRGAPSAP